MSRDQIIGSVMLVGSAAVIIAYIYGLFIASEAIAMLLLKLTGAVAVGGVFGILAWIGYTLATTPPPAPIEEIEKEIEEELKKIEEETEEESKDEGKEEDKEG